MNILTPTQETLLRRLAATDAGPRFFLAGGTALAAFYLRHRYSEDLDLFTEDPGAMPLMADALQRVAAAEGFTVEFTRRFERFMQCHIRAPGGETVKVDFAVDSPCRLEPVRPTDYGIAVDNPLDIACNKLSALFDRSEPRDFVDIYFVHRELYPFDDLLPRARQKHLGMDDYWLALSLARASRVAVLPRMIKPVTIEELKAFFLGLSDRIMERAKPGE